MVVIPARAFGKSSRDRAPHGGKGCAVGAQDIDDPHVTISKRASRPTQSFAVLVIGVTHKTVLDGAGCREYHRAQRARPTRCPGTSSGVVECPIIVVTADTGCGRQTLGKIGVGEAAQMCDYARVVAAKVLFEPFIDAGNAQCAVC